MQDGLLKTLKLQVTETLFYYKTLLKQRRLADQSPVSSADLFNNRFFGQKSFLRAKLTTPFHVSTVAIFFNFSGRIFITDSFPRSITTVGVGHSLDTRWTPATQESPASVALNQFLAHVSVIETQ